MLHRYTISVRLELLHGAGESQASCHFEFTHVHKRAHGTCTHVHDLRARIYIYTPVLLVAIAASSLRSSSRARFYFFSNCWNSSALECYPSALTSEVSCTLSLHFQQNMCWHPPCTEVSVRAQRSCVVCVCVYLYLCEVYTMSVRAKTKRNLLEKTQFRFHNRAYWA